MKSNGLHPLVRQLSLCGQIAEHKAQMLREHGGEEASVLDALTAEQQNQLPGICKGVVWNPAVLRKLKDICVSGSQKLVQSRICIQNYIHSYHKSKLFLL